MNNKPTKAQKEQLADAMKYGKCECGNVAKEMHTCPYAIEIHADYDYKCNCCFECVSQCCDGI